MRPLLPYGTASTAAGLVIQNYDGEEAVVSGAVPVPVSKAAWSVHNASTRTYKLDLRGHAHTLPKEAFGLRVGSRRATRAKFPNGNPEGSAAHCAGPQDTPFWAPCNYTSVFDDTMLRYFPREHDRDAVQHWCAS